MIVISGALVAVATVLLVVGLASSGLTFVYASIAVSVLAFAALVAGVLQRRGEEVELDADGAGAGAEPDAPKAEGVTAIYRTADRGETTRAAATARAAAPLDAAVSGDVLVVPGRPRYHVTGCRYLADKDVESLPVRDARAEGFTACGVCRPDDSLVAVDTEPSAPARERGARSSQPTAEPTSELATEPVVDSGVPGEEVAAEDAPAAQPVEQPGRRRSAAAQAAATRRATSAARTRTATASTGGRVTAEPATEPATEPAGTPAAAPAAARKAPAASRAATAAAGARAGKVVVIPARGRFHRAECRYVRGAEGTSEMTATQAKREGFQACGVCKP